MKILFCPKCVQTRNQLDGPSRSFLQSVCDITNKIFSIHVSPGNSKFYYKDKFGPGNVLLERKRKLKKRDLVRRLNSKPVKGKYRTAKSLPDDRRIENRRDTQISSFPMIDTRSPPIWLRFLVRLFSIGKPIPSSSLKTRQLRFHSIGLMDFNYIACDRLCPLRSQFYCAFSTMVVF